MFHLHVSGQVIRTTPEHPFYEQAKGWTAAGALRIGDLLATADGRWVAVEDLLATGELTTVYNLRIADYHTYFVGDDDWGFSVWAHNAEYDIGRYGDKVSDGVMHHGVFDAWLKANVQGYKSRASHNVTMELSRANHDKTTLVFRDWLESISGRRVGAKVDWENMSPREVKVLAEKMFDAANTPVNARHEFYSELTRYLYREA